MFVCVNNTYHLCHSLVSSDLCTFGSSLPWTPPGQHQLGESVHPRLKADLVTPQFYTIPFLMSHALKTLLLAHFFWRLAISWLSAFTCLRSLSRSSCGVSLSFSLHSSLFSSTSANCWCSRYACREGEREESQIHRHEATEYLTVCFISEEDISSWRASTLALTLFRAACCSSNS